MTIIYNLSGPDCLIFKLCTIKSGVNLRPKKKTNNCEKVKQKRQIFFSVSLRKSKNKPQVANLSLNEQSQKGVFFW